MGNSYFKFKQFTIQQENSAMKVGTDGVLLGCWADCSDSKNILDIGTGTGLIAIMMAQRSNAAIDAVEIDFKSYSQALENVSNCKWSDRINIYNESIQNFAINSEKHYDLIISNPPYFINSLKSEKSEKNISKHNDQLSFHDLLHTSFKLMADDGKFCLILPFAESQIFIEMAVNLNLYCKKKTIVFPCSWKNPNRLLLEFRKKEFFLIENNLTIELDKRHEYSSEYKNLTTDFYL